MIRRSLALVAIVAGADGGRRLRRAARMTRGRPTTETHSGRHFSTLKQVTAGQREKPLARLGVSHDGSTQGP